MSSETPETTSLDTTNYYTILGVHATATPQQIRKAYYTLALIHHPDKNNGNDDNFKILNNAYKILSDERKKRKYDVTLGQENANVKDSTRKDIEENFSFAKHFGGTVDPNPNKPKTRPGENSLDFIRGLQKHKNQQEKKLITEYFTNFPKQKEGEDGLAFNRRVTDYQNNKPSSVHSYTGEPYPRTAKEIEKYLLERYQ